MKRHLSVGESSALFFQPSLKHLYLLYTLIGLFLIQLPTSIAQEKRKSILPLVIGDKIPDETWNVPLRVTNSLEYPETMTLEPFKNKKLLILNFWSPSCKPCLESLFLISRIIKELDTNDVVQVPMTARHNEQLLNRYFEKEKRDFFTIVNANDLNNLLLGNYTQHFGIVWIKDGKLYAVPRKESITFDNIQAIISGSIEPVDIQNNLSIWERRTGL